MAVHHYSLTGYENSPRWTEYRITDAVIQASVIESTSTYLYSWSKHVHFEVKLIECCICILLTEFSIYYIARFSDNKNTHIVYYWMSTQLYLLSIHTHVIPKETAGHNHNSFLRLVYPNLLFRNYSLVAWNFIHICKKTDIRKWSQLVNETVLYHYYMSSAHFGVNVCPSHLSEATS